jgi:hypothetical protein
MSTSDIVRSRVSRETRQLLVAALVALLVLWSLARVRFPGQAPSPNPIPSLLSQISAAPRFATLAGEIAELQTKLSGAWFALPVSGSNDLIEPAAGYVTAMRLPNNAALLLLRNGDRLWNEQDVVASDRVTGLAIIHTKDEPARVEFSRWTAAALDRPHYLMATVGTPAGVSLRPVLVGSLHETTSPAWTGPIWSVADGTDLSPSAFVFTTEGEIAGLVVREPSGLAIVPWDSVLIEAMRLRERERVPAADLGIEVRPLTPTLARATSASQGVVVAWVDRRGPLGRLAVGDVIESINTQPILHTRDWEVASSRLPTGRATLNVRRRGKSVTVDFLLPPAGPSPTASLGLQMKDVRGVGTTVVHIEPRSAATIAGLQEGDVITLAGDINAPTAAQIGNAFRSARTGEAIMLAITRGPTHLVLGLVK